MWMRTSVPPQTWNPSTIGSKSNRFPGSLKDQRVNFRFQNGMPERWRYNKNVQQCARMDEKVYSSFSKGVEFGGGNNCRGRQKGHGIKCKISRESLIPETLRQLNEDTELLELHARIAEKGQSALTHEEELRREKILESLKAPSFYQMCQQKGVTSLKRDIESVLQLNIGLYCNQTCRHCHVESSPRRTELMDHSVAERCIELLDSSDSVKTLDITGGAPELCPEFRYLVEEAYKRPGIEIIDRCNLTVLLEPGQEDLAKFLAEHSVRVVASLPCYSKENVDSQRGGGVFQRSIKGLKILNEEGYGVPGSGLFLDLVYNPGGVFLTPPQASLEEVYRNELNQAYGIVFSNLFCLNNMPIKRWSDELIRQNKLEEYMELLVNSFNPAAAKGIMCRNTISVGWDGRLYDCDFNQQIELGLGGENPPKTVFDIESLSDLVNRPINTKSHCYGCTAGSGSSCQGSTL